MVGPSLPVKPLRSSLSGPTTNATVPLLLREGPEKSRNGPLLISAMLVKVYGTAAALPTDRASAAARKTTDVILRMTASYV